MTAEIVKAIAGRLADPDEVATIAARPGNVMNLPMGVIAPWGPMGLSDAHPGVALLFAELGAADPAQRPHVQGHLAAALAASAPPPVPTLYGGAASLGFTAHAAALAFGGYGTLLSHLDQAIAGQARRRVGADQAKIATGGPIGDWGGYDVISGGAGIGRHLLARYELTGDEAVREILCELLAVLVAVALADDVTVEGRRVSAWWVFHDATMGGNNTAGHLNLGLAHGLGGPLALLALAWRAGVRVERQEEAMLRIVTLLDEYRLEDSAGPYWPHWVTLDSGPDPRRLREVWCYGSAGMARALYLAGAVTGEKDWQNTAHAAMHGALATANDHTIHDFALCHGWAGLLQITSRMAYDTGDAAYAEAADKLAARISNGFDPETAFGFRYTHPAAPVNTDRPGFLEGAAGIALALHCHATGEPPVTNWDAALLLN